MLAFALGALGVLALRGKRVHPPPKIFLLTLAILDDPAAILIIPALHTAELKAQHLGMALIAVAFLAWLNWRGARRLAPYPPIGAARWFFVLKSGALATVAGAPCAFFIALMDRRGKPPLRSPEPAIHPWSAVFILPIFAFANAGIGFEGMTFGSLRDPPPPGIAAGLLPGKRLGAVGFAYAAIRGGPAKMPEGVDRVQIHGLSLPAGIGFTMSPFIGGLSFSSVELHDEVRRGVIFGSGVSRPPGFNARGKAAEDRRPQAPAE